MIFINNEKITEKTAVALGIFDGVHLGHRKILNTAKNYFTKGLKFAVFTFKTESVEKKHGELYEYIYTENQKNCMFEKLGADYVYSPYINSLMNMSGEEFCHEILVGKMNAKAVVCGKNFRFGNGATCGVKQLQEFGNKYNFEVCVCDTLKKNGEAVSSGRIKQCLKNGDIVSANELLGERYFIAGKVVTGNQIGRTINFPTLNQLFEERQIVPKMGAYATYCELFDNKYGAVTNIGVKPTVESDINPLAETHILDFSGNLYGQNIKINFIEFLRTEQKFPSVEHLKKQIEIDSDRAKTLFLSNK